MRYVILSVIVLIAVAAAFLALKLTDTQQDNPVSAAIMPTETEEVEVLVAKDQILAGDVIQPEMLSRQPYLAHLLNDNIILADDDAGITNLIAKSDIGAGELVLRSQVARPSEANPLAAGLPEGMRALTLKIDAISGVAGYLFPGDRVDVLLTHDVIENVLSKMNKKLAVGNASHSLSEVLVTNARIIAVDIRRPSTAKKNTRATARAPGNITLAVTPEEAQLVLLAEKNGNLSLVLRSFKDRNDQVIPAPTFLPEVTRFAPVQEALQDPASAYAGGSGDDIKVTIVRGTSAKDQNVPPSSEPMAEQSVMGGANEPPSLPEEQDADF